jgi:tetratricopeptide (TPR) repeat protein
MNPGFETDIMTILTALLVVETLVIIYLTIKLLKKDSNGISPGTATVIKEILRKVPTPSDPPAFSREDIQRIEERISSIKEAGELFALDLFIKLGNEECVQGNLQKALIYYHEILKKAQYIGDLKRIASCLNNMGIVYSEKGDLDTALEYYENALKIDRDIGYSQGEANVLDNMGIVYSEKGDLDTALEYYEKALKIDRDTGYNEGEAIDYRNIAAVYRKKGDLEKAGTYEKKADRLERVNW